MPILLVISNRLGDAVRPTGLPHGGLEGVGDFDPPQTWHDCAGTGDAIK